MTTAATALVVLDLAQLIAISVVAVTARPLGNVGRRALMLWRGFAWIALAAATAIATASLLASHHRAAPIGVPTLAVDETFVAAALVATATGLAPNLRRSATWLAALGAAASAGGILALVPIPLLVIWPVVTFPVAVAIAALWRLPRRWPRPLRGALVAVAAIGLVVSFLLHPPPVSLEIAGTPQHTFTIAAPAAQRASIETLSSGVLTDTEHTAQRSVTLSLAGVFDASRPNFHQVVNVAIRLVGRPALHLVVDAAGIPQPNGALALVHSRISLQTGRRFLRGVGHLTTFAPDALIGTLGIDHHAWSILVSLDPIGDGTTRATVTLWPSVGLHLS